MTTRRLACSLLMALAATTSACAPNDTVCFVRNKGADMPVMIRGNLRSDTLIVFVHGGPGSQGLTKTLNAGFGALERDYTVAYWEQRAAGSSQGNATPDTLHLPQYVEDMDWAIDLLREKYPTKKLVLLGHSFGGTVGSAYLADARRQAKVTGWIEVDGAHSVVEGNRLSWQWAQDRLKEKPTSGVEGEHWQRARTWYAQHPSVTVENFAPHLGFIQELEDSLVPPQSLPFGKYVELGMSTPFSPFVSSANQRYSSQAYTLTPEFLGIDLSSQLGSITLPSLVLWGRYDGRLPVALGTEGFNALGTPPASKSMHVFEHSTHNPYEDEPEAFAQTVKDFVGRL